MDEKRKALYINLLDNALNRYRQGENKSAVKMRMTNSGLGEKQLAAVAEAALKAYQSETKTNALRTLLLGVCFAIVGILAAFVFNNIYDLNTPASIVCSGIAILLGYRSLWLYRKIKKAAA